MAAMGSPRRRPLAVAVVTLALCFIASCGGEEPRRLVGSEVAIPVMPALPGGGGQTISLQGTERGEGAVGVVLAHMLGSSQFSWQPLVEPLVSRDFHVLTFDFRGHGLSGGDRNPSLAALDLRAAVDKLRSLGATKIFVIGASMGGTAAVAVAAEQKLEGVVSLSAPLKIDELDAADAVGRLDEPSLFIAGEKDGEYTDAAKEFASRAPEPKRLQIIIGSGAHGTDLLSDAKTRQRVIDLILDFLIVNRG
jgi:pimeloyl-ACP methyl ester carboxylesterase